MLDADLLIASLAEILPDLPALVGSEWPACEAALLIRLRALEAATPATREQACDALLEVFETYPAALDRLLLAYGARAEPVRRGGAAARPRVSGAVPHTRYLEIPVFYATDRAPAVEPGQPPFFTGDRSNPAALRFGIVNVSVPDDHRKGTLDKPRWWKLQFRQDPEKFVLALGAVALERAEFVARARELVSTGVLPEALVFVHGYTVGFVDAARRAAQIAYDLQFEGLPMLYSWASEGTAVRYGVDRGNAQFSPPRFQQFLALALGELSASWVHAIAHSMGNEVLVNALRDFDAAALPEGAARLDQIIFAAPDIDAQTFRDLAAKFTTRAKRFTLYASSRDMALLASQAIHKYPRAGQAGEGLVVVDGVETIDASELDTGLMSHSYIGDHTSILSDIFYLLRRGSPGDRFGLVEMASPLGRYWAFVPQGK